jgi:prepilin-type N-terminal cleavage/methylation domain-containing protein
MDAPPFAFRTLPGIPVSIRRGFTLIELLIVIVIIGILAAIAIPKFGATKERAYLAAMKSDLRNLITAQESYFAENVTYTSNLGTLFQASPGVTVTIGSLTGEGFAATASHNGTVRNCTIAIGPAAAGGVEGSPLCP